MRKKERGQFYTVNASYILQDLNIRLGGAQSIIEPFCGNGDLLEWVAKNIRRPRLKMYTYDIEPKKENIIQRDTLLDPPDYKDAWVITNPPYLARNKSTHKEIFEKYNTNDLYKCFIKSIVSGDCYGGTIIIPAGFFFSPRLLDVECRSLLLSQYHIPRINYFEETVFPDTNTTVVAFSFYRTSEKLVNQDIKWVRFPSRDANVFRMDSKYDWIIGGEVYKIPLKNPSRCRVERLVDGKNVDDDTFMTHLTLHALDSGNSTGRIHLSYDKDYLYYGKGTSRTYATLCVRGGIVLDEEKQIGIAVAFNKWIEAKRAETWSLFLPQYRESKEYARKRIPFDLAYRIIDHLIDQPALKP